MQTAADVGEIAEALMTAEPWLQRWRIQLLEAMRRAASPSGGADPVEAWGAEAMAARRTWSRQRLAAGPAAWRHWATAVRRATHDPALGAVSRAIAAIDLRSHRIEGTLDLCGLAVETDLRLDDATVCGEIWLNGASCRGRFDARRIRVAGLVNLECSEFAAGIDLEGAVLDGRVEARNISVVGGVILTRARIARDSWLRNGRFEAGVVADGAEFAGEAGFGSSTFGPGTSFADVRFGDNAGFDGCRFAGAANFSGVHVAGTAWFDGASFAEPPCFTGASFRGRLVIDSEQRIADPPHQELWRRLSATFVAPAVAPTGTGEGS